MQNTQKAGSKSFIILLILITLGVGVFYFYQNNKKPVVSQNQLQNNPAGNFNPNSSNTTQNISPSKIDVKRILYRKDAELDKESNGELYSTDFENKNPVNLSKLIGLGQYGRVTVNRDMSKIAYVTKSDTDIFVWKANSDGSNAEKIYQTNNTGCNWLAAGGISADGKAVIFQNTPYGVGDDGPACTPRSAPKLEQSGNYYLKDGSAPRYFTVPTDIEISENSRAVSGANESYTGYNRNFAFYNNNILFYVISNEMSGTKLSSVWVMNSETWQSKKLFDVPERLNWHGFVPQLFISPESTKVAYMFGTINSTNNSTNKQDTSEIGLFDYKNNTNEIVAAGRWAEYQGIIISPGMEYFIYDHQSRIDNSGRPKHEFHLYNVKDKTSRPLPLSGLFSVFWKNDDSFVYRFPPVSGWPPRDPGTAMLFDIKSFKSELLFGPLTDIIRDREMSI